MNESQAGAHLPSLFVLSTQGQFWVAYTNSARTASASAGCDTRVCLSVRFYGPIQIRRAVSCLIGLGTLAHTRTASVTTDKVTELARVVAVVVCWSLSVLATCWRISGKDLLRQLHVLPH